MLTIYSSLIPLCNGLIITFLLMVCSLGIGFCLAIAMTMGSYSSSFFLKKTIATIGFFIRGTPLLVQIYLLYFGAGQFEWVRESFLWTVLRSPTACAIIALSINSACYTTVLFDGAIRSIPQNEIMACWSLGMPKWLAFRKIILPRALGIVSPAYSNEVVIVLKATSLASTITLLDLMGVIQQLIAQTYATVEWYLVAGACYLIINLCILGLFKLLIKNKAARLQPE